MHPRPLLPLLPLLLAATLAAAAPVPIDAFVGKQTYSQARLAPDGRHLAMSVRIQRGDRTVPTMTILSLPDLKIVSTIILPRFELPANFTWITNRRLVVEKGIELGVREAPARTGEVVAVDLDGTHQEYLFGHDAFAQSRQGTRYDDDRGYGTLAGIPWPRNGHVMVSAYLWNAERTMLYDINSNNAIRALAASIPESGLRFVTDDAGKPHFALGGDADGKSVLFRRDQDGNWQRQPNEGGSSLVPFGFTADARAYYAWRSEQGGPYALMREDLRSDVRDVLMSDHLSNVDMVEYGAHPATPFAATLATGRPRAHYLTPDSPDAALHKTLSALFPEAYVHFVNFTDDGQKLLFSVHSDRDPGSYYLYDRASGKADLLLTNMPDINPDDMAERQPVRFHARDGLVLTGYLTMPHQPGQPPMPLVVMPHGGPFGVADDWFFDTDAQFLASRGYAVLQLNFRGSGGRGPRFQSLGHRDWGGKPIDDLIDGVRWAARQPGIDARRVCSYGWSYGGYAALMLPIRAPELFRCAVGAAGVYDLAELHNEDNVRTRAKSRAYLRRTLGADTAALDAASPAKLAPRLTVPVLLVHGTKDEVVSIGQSRRMREAMQKAGQTPAWMEVENEGHGFYDSAHQKQFYERLESFLRQHLGP